MRRTGFVLDPAVGIVTHDGHGFHCLIEVQVAILTLRKINLEVVVELLIFQKRRHHGHENGGTVICGLVQAVGFYHFGVLVEATGKEMPVAIWCYTFASAALIGIPPASGFISKWYLATGALASGIDVFSWLGPVVLLVSALLTAGYLLPITVNGFLPGADYDYAALEKKEPEPTMLLPLLILAALAVILGLLPNPLTSYITGIVAGVL